MMAGDDSRTLLGSDKPQTVLSAQEMRLSVLWQQKPISCCERKQNARKEKATIACIALLARATPEKHIARL